MTNRIHPLIEEWYAGQTASESDFAAIEQHLGVSLPSSYKQFMLEFGSGEASLSQGNVIFYAASDLLGMHSEVESGFERHRLLLFGTNGGGEAFAFDLCTSPCRMVMVPFISDYGRDRMDLGTEISDLFGYTAKF